MDIVLHALLHNVELLLDRHLDTTLLCSVFVVCRVSSLNIAFADIVRTYLSIWSGNSAQVSSAFAVGASFLLKGPIW